MMEYSCSDIAVDCRGPFLRQPKWLKWGLSELQLTAGWPGCKSSALSLSYSRKYQWKWQQLPTWDPDFFPSSPWSPHAPGPSWILLVPISGFFPSFSRLLTQLRCCPDFWALSFPETSPCLRIWKSTSKRNQPLTMACASRCLPGLRHYKCPCLKQQKNYWKRSASLLEFPE